MEPIKDSRKGRVGITATVAEDVVPPATKEGIGGSGNQKPAAGFEKAIDFPDGSLLRNVFENIEEGNKIKGGGFVWGVETITQDCRFKATAAAKFNGVRGRVKARNMTQGGEKLDVFAGATTEIKNS